MRGAHARNASGNDLTPFGHERVQQLGVFVIDVVDLLDTETAHFLAPEILLFLCDDSLVASSGPLPGAAWSSSRFRHRLTLHRPAGHYRRGSFGHLSFPGRLRRR